MSWKILITGLFVSLIFRLELSGTRIDNIKIKYIDIPTMNFEILRLIKVGTVRFGLSNKNWKTIEIDIHKTNQKKIS